MPNMMRTDVMIVGGGTAGARAAISAADAGASVLLVCKGTLGACGASTVPIADYAGVTVADGHEDPSDSPEALYEDIIRAGGGLCDRALARVLAEETPRIVPELMQWGLTPSRRPDGEYLITKACFSSKCRTYKYAGHGKPIVDALAAQIRKRNVTVCEETMVVDLIRQDGQVVGAILLNAAGGIEPVGCGSVILATGGAGQLFRFHMSPSDVTGDGYALGLQAGASLFNMEFMQYGIAIIEPKVLLAYWLWPLYPALRNGEDEEFLRGYLPAGMDAKEPMRLHGTHFPFTSNDASKYIEIAMQQETAAGRVGPLGGMYIDFRGRMENTDLPDNTAKMLLHTLKFLHTKGIDLHRRPYEIACHAHAFNGGLRVDTHGATGVPNLYAVGETASGAHGADRLGGGMFPNCLVFGRRAGEAAAQNAAGWRHRAVDADVYLRATRRFATQLAALRKTDGMDCDACRERLQRASQTKLLLLRSEESILEYLAEVREIRTEMRDGFSMETGKDVWKAMELRNLLDCGEAVAKAALLRNETRGSHVRSDCPDMQDRTDWVFVERDGDGQIKARMQRID